MNTKGKQFAIWGVILQFGFLIGIVGTVIGMLRAFLILSKSGGAQPEALASDISLALSSTTAGMIISLVGVVLLLIALFGSKYRAAWFRTAMWILSILWLFSIPIGTILGIVVIIYLGKHGDEFTEQSAGVTGDPRP